MLVYGAGGHARVVIETIESTKQSVSGIFDDYSTAPDLFGYRIVGKYSSSLHPAQSLVVAIGNNLQRMARVEEVNHDFACLIYPTAVVSSRAETGAGAVVLHNSTIQSQARIGRHAIVNTSASVGHDCQVGDFAHICPNTTLCGTVKIGTGTMVGAGAVVIQNITIGKWCLIGAGACVVQDVPDYSVVMGVPGRIVRMNLQAIKEFERVV